MSGYSVQKAASLEVLAAWVAPKTVVSAVAASPGWRAVGEYYLPLNTTGRLAVVLSVSAPGLTARARLWDVEAGEPVGPTITTTSETPTRILSAEMELTGTQNYQLQVECTGAVGGDQFAVLESGELAS